MNNVVFDWINDNTIQAFNLRDGSLLESMNLYDLLGLSFFANAEGVSKDIK